MTLVVRARRWLNRTQKILKWSAVVGCIFSALALGVVCLLIGTERGRLWSSETVLRAMNQRSNLHVTLDGLRSPQLGHWQLRSLRILRGGKAWIEVQDVNLRWQIKPLLQRRIIVDSIHAGSLILHQVASVANVKPEEQEGKSFDRRSLPDIHIRNLKVGEFRLVGFAFADARQAPGIQINGELDAGKSTPWGLALSVNTLQPIASRFQIKISTDNISEGARLEGRLQEPAGGWASQLLALPEKQAIDASFLLDAKINSDGYRIDLNTLQLPMANRQIVASAQVQVNELLDSAELIDLRLAVDETEHTAKGKWHAQAFKLNAKLTDFPLDLLAPWNLPLNTGKLNAQLQVGGPLQQPQGSGTISVQTHYKNAPLSVNFVGTGNSETMTISRLDGTWGTSGLKASSFGVSGKLDWASEQTDIQFKVKQFDLQKLQHFDIALPEHLAATLVSAEGTVTGKVRDPEGSVNLVMAGRYLDQALDVNASISKKDRNVLIQHAELKLHEGFAAARGELNINSFAGEVAVDIHSLPLNLLKLAGISWPENLHAKADTALTIQGDLRNPGVSGYGKIQGAYTYNAQDIPFLIEAKGERLGEKMILESLLVQADQTQVLTLQGSAENALFDLNLQANKLPIELLSAFGWYIQPGQFSADLHSQGTADKVNIQGTIQYQTEMHGYDAAGKKEDIAFTWNMAIDTQIDETLGQYFSFDSRFTRNQQAPGQLSLKIPTQPYLDYFNRPKDVSENNSAENNSAENNSVEDKPPLKATLEGQLNLQTLSFLLDPELHQLNGNLKTDMEFSGSLGDPTFDGSLIIEGARYENAIGGTLVERINCAIHAKQGSIHFADCGATDGGSGKYQLDGAVQLPLHGAPGLVDLSLEVQRATIVQRRDIESEATGKIQVSGDFKSLHAAGTLDIAPLSAKIDSGQTSGIPKIQVERMTDGQTESPSENATLSPEVQLDVLIRAKQQAFLRGRGLEAELEGQIHLRGTAKKPRYDGEFKTVRGVLEVFGKKFTLEQGQVNLANDAIGIAITAVYDQQGQRIIANISGTNDDYKIQLSATPSMPEDEILAFIIFGKSIQAITPFEAIRLASAVQTLRGGGGAFDPIRSARDALGVDTLSIETEKTEAGDTGVNVGVGKYLNEKVYLELQRTPHPSQPWKGNIEIELTPKIHLESSTGGNTGIEGAEIKWKNDY